MRKYRDADGKVKAECNHCKKEFDGSSLKGTTHLKNHLQRCPANPKRKSGSDGRDWDDQHQTLSPSIKTKELASLIEEKSVRGVIKHFSGTEGDTSDEDLDPSSVLIKLGDPNARSSSSSAIKKRKKRSEVWDEMRKYRDADGKVKAECNHCKKEFDGSSLKGTTHLKNHLQRCPANPKRKSGSDGRDWDDQHQTLSPSIKTKELASLIEEKSVRGVIKHFSGTEGDTSDEDLDPSSVLIKLGDPNARSSSSSAIKKRKKRSEVWDEMRKYRDADGKVKAECNHCKKEFDGSSLKETTHLKNHLQRCPANPKRKSGSDGRDWDDQHQTLSPSIKTKELASLIEEKSVRGVIKHFSGTEGDTSDEDLDPSSVLIKLGDPNARSSSSSAIKKRKKRSEVWDEMRKYRDADGKVKAECNHCKKEFDGSSLKETTHLKNHLQRCPANPKRKSGSDGRDWDDQHQSLSPSIKIKELASLIEEKSVRGVIKHFSGTEGDTSDEDLDPSSVLIKLGDPNARSSSSSAIKKRKKRSEVWDEMRKYRDADGKVKAECNHCKKEFDGSSLKGTTHLKNHLQRCPANPKRKSGSDGRDWDDQHQTLSPSIKTKELASLIEEKSVRGVIKHFSSTEGDTSDEDLDPSSVLIKLGDPNAGSSSSSAIKKRKKCSEVWEEMRRYRDADGKVKAECNHCKKEFDGSSLKGTTHLENHLERCPANPKRKSGFDGRDGDDQDELLYLSMKTKELARLITDEEWDRPKFDLREFNWRKDDILQLYQEEIELRHFGAFNVNDFLII
ncbi:uncharacterized protein LOC127901106 isoform X5 [Citrus sinensis]|uniref:uncharacterized protein LOC127901106 isoform X5 n=1 Tax=Citrus sinensis TaxID=2711 RepID=UPI002279BA83|nr:uncharacterized protein LOC127901106 isoform X5 [Citrus sinensis]